MSIDDSNSKITTILSEIKDDISSFKTDITDIKSDLSTVKKDLSSVKTNLNTNTNKDNTNKDNSYIIKNTTSYVDKYDSKIEAYFPSKFLNSFNQKNLIEDLDRLKSILLSLEKNNPKESSTIFLQLAKISKLISEPTKLLDNFVIIHPHLDKNTLTIINENKGDAFPELNKIILELEKKKI